MRGCTSAIGALVKPTLTRSTTQPNTRIVYPGTVSIEIPCDLTGLPAAEIGAVFRQHLFQARAQQPRHPCVTPATQALNLRAGTTVPTDINRRDYSRTTGASREVRQVRCAIAFGHHQGLPPRVDKELIWRRPKTNKS